MDLVGAAIANNGGVAFLVFCLDLLLSKVYLWQKTKAMSSIVLLASCTKKVCQAIYTQREGMHMFVVVKTHVLSVFRVYSAD